MPEAQEEIIKSMPRDAETIELFKPSTATNLCRRVRLEISSRTADHP